MLIFPLKKQWYEKIKSGEKTIEYREVKQYWTSRLWKENCLPSEMFPFDCKERQELGMFPIICYLQLGYNPETRLRAFISKVEIINGKNTDLHIDKPVYAIHLTDVKEVIDEA
jgi:hypothetical protein